MGNTPNSLLLELAYINGIPGGQTSNSIKVKPGTTTPYTVTATTSCGQVKDGVIVNEKNLPVGPVFNDKLIEHCFNSNSLTISANGGSSYLWTSGGETNSSITINNERTYEVTIYNEFGCPLKESIVINNRCNTAIFIPDAFSPNNDGLNDNLEIFGHNFTDFEIRIFNRWGEIIFISTDRNNQWDGRYLGEDMPIGSYPWIISYKNSGDESKEHTLRGSISLIR